MKRWSIPGWGWLFATVLVGACKPSDPEGLKEVPPPSIAFVRLDSIGVMAGSDGFADYLRSLIRRYPAPTEVYFRYVMGLPMEDSVLVRRLGEVFTDPYSQALTRDIFRAFPSLTPLAASLQEPVRRYLFYLQQDSAPRFFTYNSFFSYAVVTYEGWVGVGLDMFLGSDYRFYPATIRHRYLIRRRKPEYIVPNVMKALFSEHFPSDSFVDYTFLSRAIYEGKKLYFLDLTLPETPDTLKIEYSAEQLTWIESNESELWTFLVEHELLFNAKPRTVGRFFNEAPFTNYSGIPPEAPPRLGEWVGWQIVRAYVERHPDVTPLELFRMKDYRAIFQGSGYRPKARYF